MKKCHCTTGNSDQNFFFLIHHVTTANVSFLYCSHACTTESGSNPVSPRCKALVCTGLKTKVAQDENRALYRQNFALVEIDQIDPDRQLLPYLAWPVRFNAVKSESTRNTDSPNMKNTAGNDGQLKVIQDT